MLTTGELHIPLNVCGNVIKKELEFWRIDENTIEKCCWDHYCSQVLPPLMTWGFLLTVLDLLNSSQSQKLVWHWLCPQPQKGLALLS